MYRDFARSAKALERTPNGKFWRVSGDPSLNFQSPYLIWRRPEYERLTEAIRGGLRQGYKIFIVLGTAGCGKSLYALQFALQMAHRGKILFKKDDEVHIIDGPGEAAEGPYTMRSPEVQELLLNTDAWLVIDGKQAQQLRCLCKVLVACSTRKENFYELAKLRASLKLYTSAWSRDEVVQFIADFEPYRAQYESVVGDSSWTEEDPLVHTDEVQKMSLPTLAEAMETFKYLGGVPRYVLEKRKTEEGLERWQRSIKLLGQDINVAASVLGGSHVDEVSDSILHIFAEKDHRKFRCEFASDQTVLGLQQAYLQGGLLHTAAFLERTVAFSVAGALWGKLYEGLVHQVLPAGGRHLRFKTWTAPGVCSSLMLGRLKVKQFKTLEQLKALLDEEAYLRPESQSFETADAVMRFDEKTVLLQIFKRKDGKHGLKVAGLEAIDAVLQEKGYEVWSCVPKEYFGATGFQEYTTTHNNPGKITQLVVEVDYRQQSLDMS